MAGEIFNPNPVVFSASKSSGRKADVSVHSLWIDDANKIEDETDEVEAIDQDEIYGIPTIASQLPLLTLHFVNRSHSPNIRPGTSEHP
jgi:hypothetical protein